MHTHPTDRETEAQVAKGVHSFVVYGAQAVGQVMGSLAFLELTFWSETDLNITNK